MLILRPQSAARADTAWRRALVDDPESIELLGVCLSDTPEEWYEEWCEALGTEPTAAVITTPELAGDDPDSVDVKTVATPSNLTGIGVKTTPYLNRWDDAVTVVEPLTVLCQYADTQEVYQFLHVLLARLGSGGETQVYADPAVEDDRSIELFKSLFDAVVEYDPEGAGHGDWNARLRQS